MASDPPQSKYDPLDAIEILYTIWTNKWTVLLVTLTCVLIAVLYSLEATEYFRAEVLLRPADTKTSAGLGSQLGGLGGLASLAGINLSNGNSAEPLAVLTSREFTGAFITDLNLLPKLFPKKWDSTRNQWKLSTLSSSVPDVRDGIRFFNKSVCTVVEDKKTGFVTVVIEWTDPITAADWANLLVDRVNERMRSRALAESEINVTYLKQELAAANLVTLQQAIGRVLETELQKLMLAKATTEYSFKIIDHAQAPKWRSSPRRLLIVGAALFLGLVLGCIFVVTRDFVRHVRVERRRAARETSK